jgi:hypothetical protein
METVTAGAMPIGFKGDGVELRTRASKGMTFRWVRLEKGVNSSSPTIESVDRQCQCPHWGYMISGRLRVRGENTSRDYAAGEAFYLPPGHAPDALEDCEYVDVSPTARFEREIAYLFTGELKL